MRVAEGEGLEVRLFPGAGAGCGKPPPQKMAMQIDVYEPSSPEERVIQNYHNDLQQVIINPLQVASKLLQEKAVSNALVSEVSTLGRSHLQNSTAVITAVIASIHSNPDQFQVFMSVLEDSPETVTLARRMRNELSELCNVRAVTVSRDRF